MSKIELKQLFQGLQNQMISQLSTNREFISHEGSKGDALENAWIEWLKKYLPNKYSVDKAIVIDSTGTTSHQIDIVIYDNLYTPFVFQNIPVSKTHLQAVIFCFGNSPIIELLYSSLTWLIGP